MFRCGILLNIQLFMLLSDIVIHMRLDKCLNNFRGARLLIKRPLETGGFASRIRICHDLVVNLFRSEVSMCPARRTVNMKSICPASVNHVSYRVISRGFSSVVDDGAK